ncbi:hypothetical protein D9M68_210460 [compost metagenome]
MKLTLHFDGSVAINTLRQAILASGDNTTIHYSAAHDLDARDMLSVLSAAGSEKNLVLGFDGARLTPRNLQQAVSFAGDRTRVEIGAAQAVPASGLVSAIAAAGDGKSVRAHFNGGRTTEELLRSALDAAGRQVDIGIGAAQSLSMETLLSALDAAGDERNVAVELSGTQPAANLVRVLEAAGASTGIAINTAQALERDALCALMLGAGNGKHLSLTFNGAQADEAGLPQLVAAAGTNTLVRLNMAETLSPGHLLTAIEATGNTRQLAIEYNGSQSAAAGLVQAVEAAGISTSVGVSSAQAVRVPSLVSALEAAGETKKLDLQFSAGQLAAADLQRLVEVAGHRTSLSFSGARALPLPVVLDALKAAA